MSPDVSLAIGDRGPRSFAIAFALTQLVEVPIYAAALRRAAGPRSAPRPLLTRAAIAFGASALTHPVVWFLWPALSMVLYTNVFTFAAGTLDITGRTLFYGALAEAFAVLAEALYLRAFGLRRALAWALLANGASVVIGTLVVWFAAC